MLRLKQALDECGIKQKALCDATGFGKTQVSLTLSSGKLPANADKFKAGVTKLVHEHSKLNSWLLVHDLESHDELYEIITPLNPPLSKGGSETLPLPAPATLGRLLCDIAGRAVLNDADDGANEMIIRLARTTSYLHRKIAEMVGHDAPWTVQTEAEAAAILTGGQA